jgi:predicted AAA+ superfamily ATPase
VAYIDRKISQRILEASQYFPALIVTGARQTGKTTLLRHLFPQYNYVTLERPLTAEQTELDPAAFLERFPPPLIIDEIQYAPSLFRFLKIRIDEKR